VTSVATSRSASRSTYLDFTDAGPGALGRERDRPHKSRRNEAPNDARAPPGAPGLHNFGLRTCSRPRSCSCARLEPDVERLCVRLVGEVFDRSLHREADAQVESAAHVVGRESRARRAGLRDRRHAVLVVDRPDRPLDPPARRLVARPDDRLRRRDEVERLVERLVLAARVRQRREHRPGLADVGLELELGAVDRRRRDVGQAPERQPGLRVGAGELEADEVGQVVVVDRQPARVARVADFEPRLVVERDLRVEVGFWTKKVSPVETRP